MATTRLIPMHVGKGKTIAKSISDRTDYAKNPDKTRGGELITSYACDARTVDTEFLISKQRYANITGRSQGKHDVIAYQIRQSFKPGEITPEKANQIGYELAMAFTKGKHAFIVCTHEDKNHIHSHIIFNSTTLDCTRKFKDFFRSGRAIRYISDQLCVENGLSIIENPKPSKGDYGTWLGDKKPPSAREKLRQAIDVVLDKKPSDLKAFLDAMRTEGFEVKEGKYLSFKAPEQKKFTRLRSLGDDYSDEAVRERIEGKRIVTPKRQTVQNPITLPTPKITLLIDIENSIKAKNSIGYERWAKVFNLKQAAQTLIFLQENNLTEYAVLKQRAAEVTTKFNDVSTRLKTMENRLSQITSLQKTIGTYSKTRDVYAEYRKSGYSKKFLAEHEGDIILHKAAKKEIDELGLTKIPSIKALQIEYATLFAQKKKIYIEYNTARKEMRELLMVKENADRLLNYSGITHEKENER